MSCTACYLTVCYEVDGSLRDGYLNEPEHQWIIEMHFIFLLFKILVFIFFARRRQVQHV